MSMETHTNALGRPTDYSPDILQKAKDYLLACESTGVMPQLAQLAYQLDISRKSIYNWADANPDFLHIVEKLMSLQEFTLVSNGLQNKFNASITKLMLSKHDYKETSATDITSGGDKFSVKLITYAGDDTSVQLDAGETPASSTQQ